MAKKKTDETESGGGATATAEAPEEGKLYSKAEVTDTGPCRKRLQVAVPPEKIGEALDAQFEELGKTAAIPGFRAGRAPRKLIENRFGKQVEEEVRAELVGDAVRAVLEDKGLHLLVTPDVPTEKIEFDREKGLSFTVDVLIRPDVGDVAWKGLEIKRPSTKVAKKDVDEALDHLRRQRAVWVPVEKGGIGKEDRVLADAVLTVDDAEAWKQEGIPFEVASDMVGELPVTDLSGKLKGKNPGDAVDLPVEVPVVFSVETARGKKGTLALAIQEVKRAKLPEIDDSLAKTFRCDTVDELHAEVEKRMASEKERSAELDLEGQILDALVTKQKFDLPDELVLQEATRLLRRRMWELQMMGMPPDRVKEHLDDLRKHSEERAVRQLRSFFILEAIAEKEKIFATEDDLEARIAAIAASSDQDPEQVRRTLEKREELDELRSQIRHDKVLDHVKSKADIGGSNQ